MTDTPNRSPLSPAAQAVLRAMRRSYDHEPTRRAIAAGILRALADHQWAPTDFNGPGDRWNPDKRTRRELRNLAEEMDEGGTADEIHLRGLRAVLSRWGHQPAPPAEAEVAELAAKLRRLAPHNPLGTADPTITRAAELLQQQHPTPVPVSERLPAMVTDGLRVAGDCDKQGRCWAGTRAFVDTSGDRDIDYPPSWELREVRAQDDVWLPAHALPLPQGEAQQ